MEETGRLGALAFAYTALLCGTFTNLFGQPLALITTGLAIGALVGGAYALVRGPRPTSPPAGKPALDIEMAVGSLVGALIGAAAGIDALLGARADAALLLALGGLVAATSSAWAVHADRRWRERTGPR